MQSHRLGLDGEAAAAAYLESQGYEILAKRYSSRSGEIDIICCNKDDHGAREVVFVEVKTRRPTLFGRPEQAISRSKMHRIYRTAVRYLYEHPHPGALCRFDVMAVYSMKGRLEIEHFEQAFDVRDFMDMD